MSNDRKSKEESEQTMYFSGLIIESQYSLIIGNHASVVIKGYYYLGIKYGGPF